MNTCHQTVTLPSSSHASGNGVNTAGLWIVHPEKRLVRRVADGLSPADQMISIPQSAWESTTSQLSSALQVITRECGLKQWCFVAHSEQFKEDGERGLRRTPLMERVRKFEDMHRTTCQRFIEHIQQLQRIAEQTELDAPIVVEGLLYMAYSGVFFRYNPATESLECVSEGI